MKLSDITRPEALLYLERYVDEKNYSAFSNRTEVEPAYRPGSINDGFAVPYLERSLDTVEIMTNETAPELVAAYRTASTVQFPVHPQIFALAETRRALRLSDDQATMHHLVQPTASSRTVLVSTLGPTHYLKLHLPLRISRFSRRWRRQGIQHSLIASKELSMTSWDVPMGLLRDVVGVWDRQTEWGYSLREAVPYPHAATVEYLVPFFSLYSRDSRAAGDRPLLVQLIEAHGADPVAFLVERLIGPLVDGWAAMVANRGLIHASHGQNVLVALNEQYLPQRPIFRDLEAVGIDEPRRRALGLTTSYENHRYGADRDELARYYSETYDYQMGHHLFEPLLQTLLAAYPVDADLVRSTVARRLRAGLSDWPFPAATYRFADTLPTDNERHLIADPELPRWR